MAEINPDIIGLTEVNPKNARWTLSPQDLFIERYTCYSNLVGIGSVVYAKDSLYSSDIQSNNPTESLVWCILVTGVV